MLGTYKMRNTLKKLHASNLPHALCNLHDGRCRAKKTVSPAWCSNTLLRPSLLPYLTHHLLSLEDTEKAPQSPSEPPAPPGAPRLRGWREVALSMGSKSHPPCLTINRVSSWLDSPRVQEQKRRKSPLSPPLGLPLAPRLAQGTWTPGCSPCHRNAGHMGDIPAAC